MLLPYPGSLTPRYSVIVVERSTWKKRKALCLLPRRTENTKCLLGNIRGYGGVAVEHATIDGIAAEKFTAVYRTPGYYTMEFMAPGYFPYSLAYQVVNKDVTVDIDLSQSRALRFLFTDRDGSAMENLSVNLRSADNPRLDVDLATDASGFCEIYVMPGDYGYDPDYEKPFYPSGEKEYSGFG